MDGFLTLATAAPVSLVILLPFAAAAVVVVLPHARRNSAAASVLACTIAACLLALILPPVVLGRLPDPGQFAPILSLFATVQDVTLEFGLGIDAVSWLCSVLMLAVCAVVQAFSLSHLATDRRIGWLLALLGLFSAGLVTQVLATGLAAMLLGWGLMDVAGILLAAFWWESPQAGRAALLYASNCLVSDTALATAIGFAVAYDGGCGFSLLSQHISPVVAACLTAALVVRMVQLPALAGKHSLSSMPLEPAAIVEGAGSAVTGALLFYRVMVPMCQYPASLAAFLAVGCIVLLASSVAACLSFDVRRILACVIASQSGIVLIVMSCGSGAIALMQAATMSLTVPLLGLAASVVVRLSGTRDLRGMGGLYRQAPVTACLFTVGVFGLTGLPPFAGFLSLGRFSERLIASGWFPVLLAMLVGLFLIAICCGRFGSYAFLGEKSDAQKGSPQAFETVCLAILAAWVCFFGVASPFVAGYLGYTSSLPSARSMLLFTLVTAFGFWLAWRVFAMRKPGDAINAGDKGFFFGLLGHIARRPRSSDVEVGANAGLGSSAGVDAHAGTVADAVSGTLARLPRLLVRLDDSRAGSLFLAAVVCVSVVLWVVVRL